MTSAGILLFILFDVLSNLSEPIKSSITENKNFPEFFILLGVFVIGFGLGLLGLIAFDQRFMRAQAGSNKLVDPTRLALMIATGIGLHNFSEGLAIGQSAGRGEIGFAALLIIGFGLHNATEGFGIVGPLVGENRPSWGFIGLAGLIGGGPTFLGTIVGYFFLSDAMFVLFLSLAAIGLRHDGAHRGVRVVLNIGQPCCHRERTCVSARCRDRQCHGVLGNWKAGPRLKNRSHQRLHRYLDR